MTTQATNALIFCSVLFFSLLATIVLTEWDSFKRGWVRLFRSIGFWGFRVPFLLVKGFSFSHPLMFVLEELAKRRAQAVKEKLGEGAFDTAFLASFGNVSNRRVESGIVPLTPEERAARTRMGPVRSHEEFRERLREEIDREERFQRAAEEARVRQQMVAEAADNRRNREAFERSRQDRVIPTMDLDTVVAAFRAEEYGRITSDIIQSALNADMSMPSVAPANQRQVMTEMMANRQIGREIGREVHSSALNAGNTGQASQASQANRNDPVNPVNPVTDSQEKSPVVPTILHIEATKEEMEALGKAEETDFTV